MLQTTQKDEKTDENPFQGWLVSGQLFHIYMKRKINRNQNRR